MNPYEQIQKLDDEKNKTPKWMSILFLIAGVIGILFMLAPMTLGVSFAFWFFGVGLIAPNVALSIHKVSIAMKKQEILNEYGLKSLEKEYGREEA